MCKIVCVCVPAPSCFWSPLRSSEGNEECPFELTQTVHPHHHHGMVTDQSASHRPAHQMTTSLLRMNTADLVESVNTSIFNITVYFHIFSCPPVLL